MSVDPLQPAAHDSAYDVAHDVAKSLADVREAIAVAAREAGRAPQEVTLVAVSKTVEAARIDPVLAAGQRHFGENRVQEAAAKWPALRRQYPDVTLHLIGPLQTNKVREAVALFDVIHSLDRPKLGVALAREFERTGLRRNCFIQVNTGEEDQKSGMYPDQVDAFVAECRDGLGLPVAGLMCIPPADENPVPHFAMLADMARRNGVDQLSMGMTADYPGAIALGATHVRVGRAIFGARD